MSNEAAKDKEICKTHCKHNTCSLKVKYHGKVVDTGVECCKDVHEFLIEYIMNYEGKSKEEVIDMIPPAVDESTEPTPKRVKQSHRRSFELVGSNESN